MEHPSTQGVYKGATIQVQKLQESRKSRKEKNDWFRIVANQSNKVLKKIVHIHNMHTKLLLKNYDLKFKRSNKS